MSKFSNPERLNNCERILRMLNDFGIKYRVPNSFAGIPTHIIAKSEKFGDVHIWPTSLQGKIWIPSINKRSYLVWNSIEQDLTKCLGVIPC